MLRRLLIMMKQSFFAGACGLLLSLGAACGDYSALSSFPAPPERRPLPPELPVWNPVPLADTPPPPISGGTLLITQDDSTAVAADPDRDAVWLIDLQQKRVRTRLRLSTGVEPGRSIEDQDGQVHVVL